MANYVLAVISLVWNWGKPRGHCGANPADGLPKVRRPRNAPIVNRAWASSEYNAVVAAASPQLRLAVVIGACTGLREGDVIRLPWSAYDGAVIAHRHAKTGEPIWIPVHAELKPLLDAAKTQRGKSIQIVTNIRGLPFTESGFRASFFKLVRILKAAKKVEPSALTQTEDSQAA